MTLPTGYGIGQSGGGSAAAESSAVRCKFGDVVVVGTIVDLSTVICTAPAASLPRAAASGSSLVLVPLLVSIDYGWTYLTPVESVFTYVPDPVVTSVTPLLVIENQQFYLKLQGVFPLSTLFCRLGTVLKPSLCTVS